MYKVGEVIQPREGETPLRVEPYEVTAVLDTSVRLIPLPSNPMQQTEQVTRTIFIPRELMAKFDRVTH